MSNPPYHPAKIVNFIYLENKKKKNIPIEWNVFLFLMIFSFFLFFYRFCRITCARPLKVTMAALTGSGKG